MRIPKRYGESKVDRCPFCNSTAVANSPEGVPVCSKHKDKKLPPLKCICGEYLDLRTGKWGPYFHCIRCGNITFKKALEVNPDLKAKTTQGQEKAKPLYRAEHKSKKEIVLTSDELDFY